MASQLETFKTESREQRYNFRSYNINGWGANNDYPQRVCEVVESSVTGRACVETYAKFIAGRGFAEESFYSAIINDRGDNVDTLLRQCAKDFAMFGGFAIHVNYNALGEVVSATHVPIEWLRSELLDDSFDYRRVALHPDWGHRAEHLRRFVKSDIDFFNLFDPSIDTIAQEVEFAEGWENYNGQIFVYSNNGPKAYPTPIYKAALVDMYVEQGLSNITLRNTRSNFLPAGFFIDKDHGAVDEHQAELKKREFAAFQTDENACKIFYTNVLNGEDAPEFKPIKTNNYDKDFENAEAKTPQNIGRAFTQPPILRAEDVGNNFGADAMGNAYDFYNSITETERQEIATAFERIFSLWHDKTINPEGNYEILPKEYQVTRSLAEKLGENTESVIAILDDTSKTDEVKAVLLNKLYGIEDADINDLLAAYGSQPTPTE